MNAEIVRGDALETLAALADEGRRFDALIADPPYCSGGTTPADRARGVASKYYQWKKPGGNSRWLEYPDAMDQLATLRFTRAWLLEAKRSLTALGYIFIFCDWRQIGVFSEALQSVGYWRGLIVWNKGNARPNKGTFTPYCEYVVWGTVGAAKSDKFAPGIISTPTVPSGKRRHPSEKPVEVLERLLSILPDDAKAVVDPFCGSGSTGVAAARRGLDFVGVEIDERFAKVAEARLAESVETLDVRATRPLEDRKA